MPVEAASIRLARHSGGEGQLAQLQLCVAVLAALEPCSHLRGGGGTSHAIVKRGRIAVEDDAFAARVPDLHLRAGLRSARGMSRQHQLGAHPVQLESEDLAKALDAADLQHDVAADLQLQVMQRDLEREPASVDRGGERQH